MLLLNAHYMALRVVSVRRAFTLLFKQDDLCQPVAEVICIEEGRFVSYDFADWVEVSSYSDLMDNGNGDWVRTVRFRLAVPRIVRVLSYARLPRREIKFSRRNIFARDNHTCQYCGRRFHASELSLDHVVPRSHGGRAHWENIVSACVRCNVRKGGRTPSEARLRLMRRPTKPRRNPIIACQVIEPRYASWQPFLERATWDVEAL